MTKKGVLSVVSGFSGAGKGTIMKALLGKYDQYALSISATTRAPRPGEENGREYFFKTREEFEQMIADDALYEYAEYQGNYYGTPKAYVNEQLACGKDVILEIEVQGAAKVKAMAPDTVLIFVTPPSAEELERRLVDRGTESKEAIAGRLARAVEEAEYMKDYDYILINDILEDAVEDLHTIIQTEHKKSSRNADFITTISENLKEFKKGE